MEKILCFSVITGKFFEINEDEKETLSSFQLVLNKKPDSKCKKCYGRMHVGKDINRNLYSLCHSCLTKCVDFSDMKKRF